MAPPNAPNRNFPTNRNPSRRNGPNRPAPSGRSRAYEEPQLQNTPSAIYIMGEDEEDTMKKSFCQKVGSCLCITWDCIPVGIILWGFLAIIFNAGGYGNLEHQTAVLGKKLPIIDKARKVSSLIVTLSILAYFLVVILSLPYYKLFDLCCKYSNCGRCCGRFIYQVLLTIGLTIALAATVANIGSFIISVLISGLTALIEIGCKDDDGKDMIEVLFNIVGLLMKEKPTATGNLCSSIDDELKSPIATALYSFIGLVFYILFYASSYAWAYVVSCCNTAEKKPMQKNLSERTRESSVISVLSPPHK